MAGIINGGAVAGNLDKLIDALATIAGNDGMTTHLLAAPDAWASLRKFKTATGSAQSLLGAGTNDAERRLLDVVTVVTPALPSGTLLAVDKTAVVSAVGDVQVAQSEHVYFGSDSMGLRCTWRFGANVVHPDRIAKLTVTPPA